MYSLVNIVFLQSINFYMTEIVEPSSWFMGLLEDIRRIFMNIWKVTHQKNCITFRITEKRHF